MSEVYFSKNIDDILNIHYKNIRSKFAKDFMSELETTGSAIRNLRGIKMRYNKIGINLYFQAKKTEDGYKARFITSGRGRPSWNW